MTLTIACITELFRLTRTHFQRRSYCYYLLCLFRREIWTWL